MNPRDPRNRRTRPSLADRVIRAGALADEYRAQVVRLPVDVEHDDPNATEWVVPKHLPPVPAGVRLADEEEQVDERAEIAAGYSAMTGADDEDADNMADALAARAALEVEYSEYVALHAAPERVFGWSSKHDARSLQFAVADRLAHRVPLQSLSRPVGPVLDQGTHPPLSLHDASACTGFAGIAAANALHGTQLGEVEARELYALAQKRDQISGENYNGAPILGVMKAGQELGYWAAYWWCFGTRDLAQAILQLGPVVLGVHWSEQLNHPDPAGVAVPGGADLGGHSLLCFGIRADLPGGPHFGLQQSYGPGVGQDGVLWVPARKLAGMLAGGGEAALPLTEAQLAAL